MSSPESVTDGQQIEEKVVVTGSSKRKRKFSVIKRNLPQDPNQMDQSEVDTDEKVTVNTLKQKHNSVKEVCKANRGKESLKSNVKSDQKCEEKGTAEGGHSEECGPKRKMKTDTLSAKTCENCNLCSEHMTLQQLKTELEENITKKFPCQMCEDDGIQKVFSSSGKLKAHIKIVHEDTLEMRFECKECPKPVWFATKTKFCYHLGAKHPGVILFVCDICTESFKLKANYKNHMAAHNIVVRKKFACEVCQGTFVNKAGYEAHKKRFPGPHIQQTCEHCGFSFSKAQHHRNHRCKKLLLEEAARARADAEAYKTFLPATKEKLLEVVAVMEDVTEQATKSTSTDDMELVQCKTQTEAEGKAKKLVLRRLVPSAKSGRTVYRPIHVQTQDGSEPMIVHEYREIDLEKESVMPADSEDQIIVQDVCGQFIDSNQVLQFDMSDVTTAATQQVFQDNTNRLHLLLWDDVSKRIGGKSSGTGEEE